VQRALPGGRLEAVRYRRVHDRPRGACEYGTRRELSRHGRSFSSGLSRMGEATGRRESTRQRDSGTRRDWDQEGGEPSRAANGAGPDRFLCPAGLLSSPRETNRREADSPDPEGSLSGRNHPSNSTSHRHSFRDEGTPAIHRGATALTKLAARAAFPPEHADGEGKIPNGTSPR